MIDVELQKAIARLSEQGMCIREMCRVLKVSRNTIRGIARKNSKTKSKRKGAIAIDQEILETVYKRCDGWVQRIQDVLLDEFKIEIGYSTLTRLIRESHLGTSKNSRCGYFETKAGVEFQHDTSPYRVKIGGVLTSIVASLLYYRFSKQRYLKFYPNFRRFEMKCFFYEALMFYKYTAPICVIDNTNLAVHRGTGKNAVFVPEMIALAKDFGFEWLAHEKGHCNRKAGEERSFWTVETNFFPGREFSSWDDLNIQALKWSTEIMASRRQTKEKIVPSVLFETEKKVLSPVPSFVREPYLRHDRGVDQEGYAALNANFYWVPGKDRGDVILFEYRNRVELYRGRELQIEYLLPPIEIRNKKIFPPDRKEPTIMSSKSRMAIDEAKIRAEVPEITSFLDKALEQYPSANAKSHYLKNLSSLQRRISKDMFVEAINRAAKYRVVDIKVIERIAIQLFRNSMLDLPLFEVAQEFADREIYQEGRQGATPVLGIYNNESDPEEGNKNE